MKRMFIASLLLLLAALLMPLLFVLPGGADKPQDPGETPLGSLSSPSGASDDSAADGEYSFTALVDGQAQVFTMKDYLPGVLAGEMPASFETEALKAQAVAARTYIMYAANRINPNHPEAAVCDNPSCCKAYVSTEQMRLNWGANFDKYYAKLSGAASDTDGEFLVYDGEPILAAFHSSSAGKTENSGAIWSSLPYLVAVDSPETQADVPGYITSAEIEAEDFKSTVLAECPEADLSGSEDGWIGEIIKNDSGRTQQAVIGGAVISGARLRALFELRSTAFDLRYEDGRFLFTVTGYGHGIGMSQFGANVMAGSGEGYKDILLHYYPGAELKGN